MDVTDRATRDEQIYQAVRVHHYTLKEVGGFVGLRYSTISVIARQIGSSYSRQGFSRLFVSLTQDAKLAKGTYLVSLFSPCLLLSLALFAALRELYPFFSCVSLA